MRTISITEASEDPSQSLWVVNISSRVTETGGDVLITIPGKGNTSHVLNIRKSWLPELVTNRYAKALILESVYFTEAVNSGMIAIIPEEDAKKLLSSPEAGVEKRRLAELDNLAKQAVAAKSIGKNVMISTGDEEEDRIAEERAASKASGNKFVTMRNALDDDNSDDDSEDSSLDKDVSPSFKGWVTKLNNFDESRVDEVKNEIKVRGEMTRSEAAYLSKTLKFQAIAARISKQLQRTEA
jgi:hypothetical protein